MSKSWEMWLCGLLAILKKMSKQLKFAFATENLQKCNKNMKTRLQHITHT